jgi:hypothetical protein
MSQNILYQQITQQPSFFGPETITESRWHQAWSEPVRQKIVPALAVAIVTSGLFAPPLDPTPSYESKWHQAWSEPVRQKPGLPANLQQSFTSDSTPFPTGSNLAWYANLSAPVRTKIGLGSQLQQSFTTDTSVLPEQRQLEWFAWLNEPVKLKRGLGAWLQQADSLQVPVIPPIHFPAEFQWLSEPVRFKPGLGTWLQQFLAYHPRLLPNPNVTAIMAAKETNNDIALFGIQVYSSVTPAANAVLANVSITEIPLIQGATASIEA